VDDHVMATAAGILSDARILVERAQEKATGYRATYDSPIDVLSIVKDICNLKQFCTQSGGLRPFGVSLLIAGVDESGLKLFQTDPTGLFYQYKAVVIGEGETEVEEILHKDYKESMTVEEGLKFCIEALKRTIDPKEFSIDRIDVGVVRKESRKMEKMGKERIQKLLK
jgi:proteasome alpha subunit